MLRLYLDQRDLIDLLDPSHDDELWRLRTLISAARVQVVLSFNHILETWKYAEASGRREVAELADSFQPAWILYRPELFRAELCAAFLRLLGHRVHMEWSTSTVSGYFLSSPGGDQRHHTFVPFRRSAFESHLPSIAAGTTASNSFSAYLRLLEETPDVPTQLANIHQDYAARSSEWKQTLEQPGDLRELIAYHFDAGWHGPPIPDLVRARFLDHLNLAECPALLVYVKIREAILADAHARSAPSEMVDVAHVVALPYCDAFSTDKRIWDYLRRISTHMAAVDCESVGHMRAFKKLSSALDWLEEGTHSAQPAG